MIAPKRLAYVDVRVRSRRSGRLGRVAEQVGVGPFAVLRIRYDDGTTRRCRADDLDEHYDVWEPGDPAAPMPDPPAAP